MRDASADVAPWAMHDMTKLATPPLAPVQAPRKGIKISSAKSKGRSLQNKVAATLMAAFPHLGEGDIRPAIMGENGADIKLSPAARLVIPLEIEAKKHKSFSVYTHYDQARSHGGSEPLVVIEADRRKPLAIVDFDYFVRLLKKSSPIRNFPVDSATGGR